MTRLENTFEGHASNGIAITPANSGGASGDAFQTTSIGVTSFFESANTGIADGGSRDAYISAAATEASWLAWTTSMGTKTTIWSRFYIAFLALPTGSIRPYGAMNGSSRAGVIQIGTNGKISLFDSLTIALATSTNLVNIGNITRIETKVICSATVGQIECKMFLTNPITSTTPDETFATPATANTLTQVTAYRFGRVESGSVATGDYWMDDPAVDDTGYIGPYVSPSVNDVYPMPMRQNPVVLRDSFR